METVFRLLIKLQTLDKNIKDLSLFIDSIPAKLKSIDKKIEDSEKIVNDAKDALSRNQKNRRDLESQVQDYKEKQKKYKSQLNSVRTNKEYSSLLKEIDEIQKHIDDTEEKIISEMLTADELEDNIKNAKLKASEAKEQLSKEKENIFQEQNKKKKEKEIYLNDREVLLPTISADQIKLYNKIASKMDGIVLSPVKDEFCSMCFMRIRPQMLNELKAEKEIILCENCGRILYFEKDDPPAEE